MKLTDTKAIRALKRGEVLCAPDEFTGTHCVWMASNAPSKDHCVLIHREIGLDEEGEDSRGNPRRLNNPRYVKEEFDWDNTEPICLKELARDDWEVWK